MINVANMMRKRAHLRDPGAVDHWVIIKIILYRFIEDMKFLCKLNGII